MCSSAPWLFQGICLGGGGLLEGRLRVSGVPLSVPKTGPMWEFPKIGVPYLGVLIRRILLLGYYIRVP